MQKFPTFLAIFMLSSFFLSNCKKGENDPKISFSTRKARVVGDWSMKKGDLSYTSLPASNAGTAYYFVFDGTSYIENETPFGSIAYIYKGLYTLSMSFKKDGNFNVDENWNGHTFRASGTWNFSAGVGKDKNKEGIIVVLNSVEKDASNLHLFNKFSTEFTYKITQLKNKEMIITSGTPLYLDEDGSRESYSSNYTLVQ